MSGNTFGQPSEASMDNQDNFLDYVASVGTTPGGARKTTASIQGTPQYAATSFNVSDILQGAFAVKDPSDTLLVVNKALTQDLGGLNNLGVSSQSSFGPSGASVNSLTTSTAAGSTSTGAAGTTGGLNPDGETLAKEWVASLPLEHPTTKAILWIRQCLASREMHLGTSPDIDVDIKQHIQYSDMPPEWKHPWNMDRINGPQGGGTKIATSVSQADTILFENARLAGAGGSFGYLTPAEEQFYCSMAWPYQGGSVPDDFTRAGRLDIVEKMKGLKQKDYKGKRILVYSLKTQKGCVCTPGDWGPHPYYSNGTVPFNNGAINGSYMGLSPDVHHALGTNGKDEFMIGWVDDATPLGPYLKATASASTESPGATTSSGPALVPADVLSPDSPRLIKIGQSNHRLRDDAARSFAAVEKVFGQQIKVTDSFRDYATQKAAFEKDPHRFGNPDNSAHPKGLAVDVNLQALGTVPPGALWDKLYAAFTDAGWCNTRGPYRGDHKEPWHFSYLGCR